MDIRMYEYPLAILQEGSLSLAARRLGISQSALSHFLSALERQLGYALFERSTRYLSPTVSGRNYLLTAEQIVAVKRQTYHAIEALENPYTSKLVLGSTPHNGAAIYSSIFKEFSPAYPKIQLLHREGYMKELTAALKQRQIDVLIATSGNAPESGLRFLRFARQELLLAVSQHHPIYEKATPLYGEPVSLPLKEAEDVPFIMAGESTTLFQLTSAYFRQFDFSPTIIFRTDNVLILREMIQSGLGCGILPATHVYAASGIRYFSLEPRLWLNTGLLVQGDRVLTEPERHLIYLCYRYTVRNRTHPHFFMDPNEPVREILKEFEP